HDVAAVQLYGDDAYAEVERNLLVLTALCHFTQDLPLAWRECFEPFQMLLDNRLFRPLSDVALDGGLDRVEQVLLAERLGQEIDRTGLHRLDSHWNVGMSGQEYDRLRFATGVEVLLKIEATQSGQTHVQNQAPRPLVSRGFKQLLRRGKAGGCQTYRLHELL